MTTNYLSGYCLDSYQGRVHQMDYLLNSPTPMKTIHDARILLATKENFIEYELMPSTQSVPIDSALGSNVRLFYFNRGTNLYERMAGTAYERGKYKVSKSRVEKYRVLLTFFSAGNMVTSQNDFNSRLDQGPSNPFKSFDDAHYFCSTMHEVTVTKYALFDDLPYKERGYTGPYRKIDVALTTDPRYFLTLVCSCKEYSSSGFRCPEILATLSILGLYSLDAELGTLEPIKKKGRPKKRGKALSKDSQNSPSSFPIGLVNEPVRSTAFGNGVIRSYSLENGKYRW